MLLAAPPGLRRRRAGRQPARRRDDGALTGQDTLTFGPPKEAVKLLEYALAIGVDGPQIPTELGARAELARLLPSAEHLARCDEIIDAGEDWRGLTGTVELARGAVAADLGDDARSDAAHQRAVEIYTAYHLPWNCAQALEEWARVLAASGRNPAAAAKRQQASAIYNRIGAAPRWHRTII